MMKCLCCALGETPSTRAAVSTLFQLMISVVSASNIEWILLLVDYYYVHKKGLLPAIWEIKIWLFEYSFNQTSDSRCARLTQQTTAGHTEWTCHSWRSKRPLSWDFSSCLSKQLILYSIYATIWLSVSYCPISNFAILAQWSSRHIGVLFTYCFISLRATNPTRFSDFTATPLISIYVSPERKGVL